MRDIEVIMRPPVKTIQEFVKRVALPRSQFKYYPIKNDKYEIRFHGHSFFHSGNPGVYLVRGEIDESIIGDELAKIRLRPTVLYRLAQGILFLMIVIFTIETMHDMEFWLISLSGFAFMLVLLFGLFTFGKHVFADAYAAELNSNRSR